MTPAASSPQVRARMQAQRSAGTAPEVAVRCALHAAGLRFRIGRSVRVPGWPRPIRPDVVHNGLRIALFVDGAYWHGCPSTRPPRGANAAWWRAKIAANRARDLGQRTALRDAGWVPVAVCEHADPAEAVKLWQLAAAIRYAPPFAVCPRPSLAVASAA